MDYFSCVMLIRKAKTSAEEKILFDYCQQTVEYGYLRY